eukprot:PhF_6_TR41742/c0_g1_i1/m.63351
MKMTRRKCMDHLLNLALVFGLIYYVTSRQNMKESTESDIQEEFRVFAQKTIQTQSTPLPKPNNYITLAPKSTVQMFSTSGPNSTSPAVTVSKATMCQRMYRAVLPYMIVGQPTEIQYIAQKTALRGTNLCVPVDKQYMLFGIQLKRSDWSVGKSKVFIASTSSAQDVAAIQHFPWYKHIPLLYPVELDLSYELLKATSYEVLIPHFLLLLAYVLESKSSIKELILLMPPAIETSVISTIHDLVNSILPATCVSIETVSPQHVKLSRSAITSTEHARCYHNVIIGLPSPSLNRKDLYDYVRASIVDHVFGGKPIAFDVSTFALLVLDNVEAFIQKKAIDILRALIPTISQVAAPELSKMNSVSYMDAFLFVQRRLIVYADRQVDLGFVFLLKPGDIVVNVCGEKIRSNDTKPCPQESFYDQLSEDVLYVQITHARMTNETLAPSTKDTSETNPLNACMSWVIHETLSFTKLRKKNGQHIVFNCYFLNYVATK